MSPKFVLVIYTGSYVYLQTTVGGAYGVNFSRNIIIFLLDLYILWKKWIASLDAIHNKAWYLPVTNQVITRLYYVFTPSILCCDINILIEKLVKTVK